MRTISETVAFKKDFKRYYKDIKIKKILSEVIYNIANSEPLDRKFKNHQLKGQWYPSYDCHILSDLVLIYQITETEIRLVRIGSHSELF
jgi:mRNA interferase YafQ